MIASKEEKRIRSQAMYKECPVYRNIDLVSKRWSLLILLELYRKNSSSKRYSELRRNLSPITSKMLSLRLKELREKEGLVKRFVSPNDSGMRCEYALTGAGREFVKVIEELKYWALKWKDSNRACELSSCKACQL